MSFAETLNKENAYLPTEPENDESVNRKQTYSIFKVGLAVSPLQNFAFS